MAFVFAARRQILVVLLLVLASSAAGAERGPSTAEERQRVVEVVELLETRPLSQEAKEGLVWLLSWIMEVPDVTVKACLDILGPASELDGLPASLRVHHVFAAARYVVENPDASGVSEEAFRAGVAGTLRAYSSLREEQAIPAHPYLDRLLAAQAAGELAAHVGERLQHCD